MAVAADASCAREYHAGLAACAGVQAALAAERGFTAELRVLEQPRGFFSAMGGQSLDKITWDFGHSWGIVTDMAVKLMPGARPFHATAEAAADAARIGDVHVDEIVSVTISAVVQWTNFKGDLHPRNLVDAAHSLVYFVAAAIVDRGFGWQHMDIEKMADPVIAALQGKVFFDPCPPPLPDRFPHRHGGTVVIRMKNGQEFSSTCKAPRGSGPRGIEWVDVEDKFRQLVTFSGLTPPKIDASLSEIRRLESSNSVARLVKLLVTL